MAAQRPQQSLLFPASPSSVRACVRAFLPRPLQSGHLSLPYSDRYSVHAMLNPAAQRVGDYCGAVWNVDPQSPPLHRVQAVHSTGLCMGWAARHDYSE